ncbi:PREDICTED: FK506-binding protein 5-like [Amphimedon queenslandica]|uniref:Uncharacterized protein n=1 Tax=Amphimedon queenslandica TaxID=400682 RepID=A0A1X7VMV6_AMPQE|nr:PREDICTED: FK506-binding protein 5-like [Amphimedon queenslandica]|eukprot:XP_011409709.1 PREDICTED: FK506-binding protein 5-like [Amphimedon queenslandica]
MGACCFKSSAVLETSERESPQDELALNSLPTSDTSNDPEQTIGEVTSKEDATKNQPEAKGSNDSSLTESVPPLEHDDDEYLVVEDKKNEDELREEQTIISPLPSPYQTYPFTVDEPEPEPEEEPEPQVEDKSIEKPTEKEEIPQEEVMPQEKEIQQEEATALEVIAKDESLTRGELVLSSSLISYDIISEVDPKSLDARSKKVNVTEKSNGSNKNEDVTAPEQPEEQKYTSFKKDTMSNKKNAEDKYKTEVVRIEDDEFVSVEYK